MARFQSFTFNPFLSTHEEVKDFLARNEQDGVAHPVDDTKMLIKKGENVVEEPAIQRRSAWSLVDVGELGNTIASRMQEASSHLGAIVDYEIVPLEEPFSLELSNNDARAIMLFCLSSLQPTYFDLVACTRPHRNNHLFSYANFDSRVLHGGGLVHSGDIRLGGGSLLLHTLRHQAFDPRSSEVVIPVGVVGYNLHPLRKWNESAPSMIIPDIANKRLHLVPVPLDEASIGDATCCYPLVVYKRANSVTFVPLPNPPKIQKINTNDKNHVELSQTIETAFLDAVRVLASPSTSPTIALVSDQKASVVKETGKHDASKLVTSLPGRYHLVFIQGDLEIDNDTLPVGKKPLYVHFGEFLSFKPFSCETPLPILTGSELRGGAILSQGRLSEGEFTQERWYALMSGADSVSVHVDDRASPQILSLKMGPSGHRLNASFFVYPEKSPKEAGVNMEEYLHNVSIATASFLRGPLSSVWIRSQPNEWRYIRGITSEPMEFGQVANADQLQYLNKLMVPVRMVNRQVYFQGSALIWPDEALPLFEKAPLDQLISQDMRNLVAQIEVAADDSRLASKQLLEVLQNRAKARPVSVETTKLDLERLKKLGSPSENSAVLSDRC